MIGKRCVAISVLAVMCCGQVRGAVVERVEVIVDAANLRLGKQVVGEVKRGDRLEVIQRQHPWICVRFGQAASASKGWLLTTEVQTFVAAEINENSAAPPAFGGIHATVNGTHFLVTRPNALYLELTLVNDGFQTVTFDAAKIELDVNGRVWSPLPPNTSPEVMGYRSIPILENGVVRLQSVKEIQRLGTGSLAAGEKVSGWLAFPISMSPMHGGPQGRPNPQWTLYVPMGNEELQVDLLAEECEAVVARIRPVAIDGNVSVLEIGSRINAVNFASVAERLDQLLIEKKDFLIRFTTPICSVDDYARFAFREVAARLAAAKARWVYVISPEHKRDDLRSILGGRENAMASSEKAGVARVLSLGSETPPVPVERSAPTTAAQPTPKATASAGTLPSSPEKPRSLTERPVEASSPVRIPSDTEEAKRLQASCAESHALLDTITNSIGMKLALIPPGEFMMGQETSGSTGPRTYSRQVAFPHRVRITKPYYLGVFEVTQTEYKTVMGENPSQFVEWRIGLDASQFPVEQVSWDEAREFCRRLSSLPEEKAAKRAYRLPTEAEWEYACRAGTTTSFHFGTKLNGEDANCVGTSPFGTTENGPNFRRPVRVGSYPPNAFGLYDMHGNVWEWCRDFYDESYYRSSPVDDPTGPSPTSRHVIRGGGWSSPADNSRVTYCARMEPDRRIAYLGVRVVLMCGESEKVAESEHLPQSEMATKSPPPSASDDREEISVGDAVTPLWKSQIPRASAVSVQFSKSGRWLITTNYVENFTEKPDPPVRTSYLRIWERENRSSEPSPVYESSNGGGRLLFDRWWISRSAGARVTDQTFDFRDLQHPDGDGMLHLSHGTLGFNCDAAERWLATFDRVESNKQACRLQIWDLDSEQPFTKPRMMLDEKETPPMSGWSAWMNLSDGYCLSPEGLATVLPGGSVSFWRLSSANIGVSKTVLEGKAEGLTAVATTPDGRILVASGNSVAARMWYLDKPAVPGVARELPGLKQTVVSAMTSPDERWLVTDTGTRFEGGVAITDLKADPPLTRDLVTAEDSTSTNWDFSLDGRWLITNTSNHLVRPVPVRFKAQMWDLSEVDPSRSPRELAVYKEGSFSLSGPRAIESAYCKVNSNGMWVVEVAQGYGKNGMIYHDPRIGRIANGSLEAPKTIDHTVDIISAATDRKARWLVTGDRNGTVRLFDLSSDNPAESARVFGRLATGVHQVTLDPEGERVVAVSSPDSEGIGTLIVWATPE